MTGQSFLISDDHASQIGEISPNGLHHPFLPFAKDPVDSARSTRCEGSKACDEGWSDLV